MKRTIRLRPYVIAIVLILLVFAGIDYLLARYIRNLYLSRLEAEYSNYAHVYSHSLTKSQSAYLAINDVLERRLRSATSTVALCADPVTNEGLHQLAESLVVDEIYLYNPQGVIEYSTRPEYLGWIAKTGHPVHNFMVSGEDSRVEDIRRDTESDRYYKYAYLRLDDGRFIQLGVGADIVLGFLSSFELQRIVDEIAGFELVDHVCFAGPDFTVIASSHPEHFDSFLDDPVLQDTVRSGQSYSRVNRDNGGELYDIYVPIYLEGTFAGTLIVGKSTSEIVAASRATTAIILTVTTFVCGLFVHVMYSSFRHNKKLCALAYHDSLTGLPNKAYLEEAVNEQLGRNDGVKRAVMLVHCRNLNEVNTLYGFDVGDRLLKEIAARLSTLVRSDRQLFRFSGNRFVFLVQGYADQSELAELAEQIGTEAESGIDPLGHQMEVHTGIVELTASHRDAVEVLTQANVTIQDLEGGKNKKSYSFFDIDMKARLHREEIIAQELRSFVANPDLGTVYLHYQPKVAVATHRMVGFEALARMNSPTLGLVSPAEFIPMAERHGLIVPLGYLILDRAMEFINRLNHLGYRNLHVAVNISVLQLVQDDFVERVEELMKRAGIHPHQLQLEITESIIIDDFPEVQAKLCPLRNQGVTIALDDFGTGYSALSRIEDLPIDCIKIDKHFIDNILVKDKHKLIINDLISMCHKLGLKVVAEGVEEEEQVRYLRESSCDIIQGYFFSKPLVEEEALAKLA
jgi:diguanylate cyclase (GGDEF)-like protein